MKSLLLFVLFGFTQALYAATIETPVLKMLDKGDDCGALRTFNRNHPPILDDEYRADLEALQKRFFYLPAEKVMPCFKDYCDMVKYYGLSASASVILIGRGLELMRIGDYAKAKKYFDRDVKHYPDDKFHQVALQYQSECEHHIANNWHKDEEKAMQNKPNSMDRYVGWENQLNSTTTVKHKLKE